MVTGSLRIAFFGTPEFAVPTLQALRASRHPVVAVVTQPDRPRGRGQQSRAPVVKELAEQYGLPLLQPAHLRDEDFLEAFRGIGVDLGVVAAYGKILTAEILAIPPRGMINVHASLLPKYRGAAPVHRAVMAGETLTGITIMRIVRALDAGPLLSTVSRPIGPDETSVDVERDLAVMGGEALVRAVDAIAADTARETPQNEALATYARRLEKSDGVVDWYQPARLIHNQIRGLHPWPHAFADLDGRRTILLRSQVETEQPVGRQIEPGTVVEAEGERLGVQTGTGVLRLLRLQVEGRRPVSAREFIAGRRVAEGAQFRRSRLPK
jgi:methionyl-tRNA formyltransferase